MQTKIYLMQFVLMFLVSSLQIPPDDQTESLQRAVEINAVRSWLHRQC